MPLQTVRIAEFAEGDTVTFLETNSSMEFTGTVEHIAPDHMELVSPYGSGDLTCKIYDGCRCVNIQRHGVNDE